MEAQVKVTQDQQVGDRDSLEGKIQEVETVVVTFLLADQVV